MTKQEVLASSGFFGRVKRELLTQISGISRLESYDKGESIFVESATCTGMYVVGDGAVKVYKIAPDGREHVLHVAEPGETFGEAAMFMGSVGYPAHAAAVKRSQVVFIPKHEMLKLLEGEPHLCFEVLASLAMWTHRLVTKLETLTLKDASARLAEYILSRAGRGELELSIPKNVLAANLAVTSETLSRLLNRFEAEGLIEADGKRIRVLDTNGLIEISEWGEHTPSPE